jgi:hypothetical protein
MGLMLAFQALRVRALRRKLLERWGACKFVASPAITGKGLLGNFRDQRKIWTFKCIAGKVR